MPTISELTLDQLAEALAHREIIRDANRRRRTCTPHC